MLDESLADKSSSSKWEEHPMSRGMTPAILAMVNERARDKMRCTLTMRKPPQPAAPGAQPQIQRVDQLS